MNQTGTADSAEARDWQAVADYYEQQYQTKASSKAASEQTRWDAVVDYYNQQWEAPAGGGSLERRVIQRAGDDRGRRNSVDLDPFDDAES